jgi:hypothetical protein
MADATEAEALERNAAALDAACRAEIAGEARRGVPFDRLRAMTATVQVTADIRLDGSGEWRFVRLRACKAVG